MADILISKFTTQIPRVGATPATPGFAESEGQDPVAPSGTPQVYTPVTIGSPANGLDINPSTQVLTIGLASTSDTGALSSTDWNTFNNKLNLTSPITGYTVGANTALVATDTILQAFGKVQGQINARISGTIASGQVAFGTGVNTVGGNSGLTYISGVNTLVFADQGSKIRFTRTGYLTFEIRQSAGTGLDFFNVTDSVSSLYLSSLNRVGVNINNPTNTLDVNGTARIRTISNLGSAATSVLVPSATGVLSLRTLSELASDMGVSTDSVQTVTTSGTINDLARTGNIIRFTSASTVTLTGMDGGVSGRTVTLGTGNSTTLIISANDVSSAAANRFSFSITLPPNSYLEFIYDPGLSRWFYKEVNTYDNRYLFSKSRSVLTASQGSSLGVLSLQNTLTNNFVLDILNTTGTRTAYITGSGDFVGTTINGTRLTFSSGGNIVTDTTTGTRIGTATNQKISFFNATPIVQPSGDILVALANLGLVASPTITQVDQFAVKTTASADQTLPSGTLTILDYDSTLLNNSTATYTVGTDGRITINTTGVYTITAGVVIEADAVTALESAFLGIFRNGDLVAISSINTTIAAGAQSGLSTSTILSLTATDIIDCRALVNSVGGVANGLARRLGTLLGANATQVNSLSITKNSM